MFIQSLKIENFKSFVSEEINFKIPNGDLGSGLNVLVGENNCGKTNLFEAIDFLRKGTKKNLNLLKNNRIGKDFFIEITFSGKIKEVIEKTFSTPEQSASKTKFLNVVFEDKEDNQFIKLRRQSKVEKI